MSMYTITFNYIKISNRSTEDWTPLPPLPQPKSELVTYPDGSKGILVTGGLNDPSTFFLNLDTLIWEPKANLPFDLMSAPSVPYKDSFLIPGGNSSSELMDTILFYNTEFDQWEVLDQRLNVARDRFPAFLVPDEIANCN